jgi:predicted RNA-binding Zn-ribbon protein involved in translation (DUF1610 family)
MTLFAGRTDSLRHLLMLTATIVLFLLLLPVIIPMVAFMHWRNDRQLRKLSASMTCHRCGELMGPNAPKLADHMWNAEADAVMKRLPRRADRRTERRVHAICPHCGLRYRYIEEFGRFVSYR